MGTARSEDTNDRPDVQQDNGTHARAWFRRRAQALVGSPTVRYAQGREDISGSGRVIDPRRAA